MENIILIPTRDRGAGLAILRKLDELAAADAIELLAGALVERSADGRWYLPDESSQKGSYRGALSDGVIGALMDLLGGPCGLLLGGAALLMGGSSAEGAAGRAETIVHACGRLVPPGSMAAFGDVSEMVPTAIDDALALLGVSSWRMTRGEAEAQLQAALGHNITGKGT